MVQEVQILDLVSNQRKKIEKQVPDSFFLESKNQETTILDHLFQLENHKTFTEVRQEISC